MRRIEDGRSLYAGTVEVIEVLQGRHPANEMCVKRQTSTIQGRRSFNLGFKFRVNPAQFRRNGKRDDSKDPLVLLLEQA